MNAVVVSVVLLGLVASAAAIGLLWRRASGRVRTDDSNTVIDLAGLSSGAVAGKDATLLQFSTEVCAACTTTARTLESIAERFTDVAHVEIDVTRRADIASRFNLLQSPTTFILDGRWVIRARIGGAPLAAEVLAELERILATASTADAAIARPA
jgi:thiol-disulfide isomerase/thioredoxin